jgi:predicted PhzF superfamily epimerase YddE/YHI9
MVHDRRIEDTRIHAMDLPCYQVDAFTRRAFAGNPAAVCPLDEWLGDELMLAIAGENAVAETAFYVPRADGDFDLRWFTPAVEVDLCGHATLASALVLMELEPERDEVRFHTRSGPLKVRRERGEEGELFCLDFPARPPVDVAYDEAAAAALGRRPQRFLRARDLVAVFGSADDVVSLTPDLGAIARLPDTFAVIATAPGHGDVDFVSRFFAPAKGVPEDPVTGSAHCTLTPFWSARLGKSRLAARQVSPRGGEILCDLEGERVKLRGAGVLVKRGVLHLP